MAYVDRFAAPKIHHLPTVQARRADCTHFIPVAHDDLVSGSNLWRRVDHTHGEDVPFREEVLNLDPVRLSMGENFATGEGERQHAAPRVHHYLHALADDAYDTDTPAKLVTFTQSR